MQIFNIVLGMLAALVFTAMAFVALGLFGIDPAELKSMGLIGHGREILSMNQFEWRVVLALVMVAVGFGGFMFGGTAFKLVVAGLLLGTAAWLYFELDVEGGRELNARYVQVARLLLVAGNVMAATLLVAKVGLMDIAKRSIKAEMEGGSAEG